MALLTSRFKRRYQVKFSFRFSSLHRKVFDCFQWTIWKRLQSAVFLFSQFQQGNSQHSLGEQHYPKYSPSLYRLKMGVNQTQRTLRNIRIINPKMCPHMCFQAFLKDHRWGLASTKISDCQHCHPITAFYHFKITVYSKACFNRTELLAFQRGSSKTPLNVILSS